MKGGSIFGWRMNVGVGVKHGWRMTAGVLVPLFATYEIA